MNEKLYNGIVRPAFTPEAVTQLKADEVFVFASALGAGNICLPESFVKTLR